MYRGYTPLRSTRATECRFPTRMNEFADPGGPDESASTADRAGPVVVGDQAQPGQMPTSVVLPDRGESEFQQGECGIEAGRGKVVHEGPWVVMES